MSTTPTPLPTRRTVLSIENEVERALDRVHQPLPKAMPLEELGRMSGEAIKTQYEATAKAIESLSDEVNTRIKGLEEQLVIADRDLKMIEEAAAIYRDKGHHAQAEIEHASTSSANLRKLIDSFKDKPA
jgi:hypothetical protein